MIQFSVDQSLCTHCGLCASDCASRIIEQAGDQLPAISPENEEKCLQCQHCFAVCPTGAISILGKNSADSQPVSAIPFPSFEQMDHFVRSRRSIRHYKDENVDPKLIDALLKSLAHAPTGVNFQGLTFQVIDDKEIMHRFRDQFIDTLVDAAAHDRIPEQFARLKQMVSFPREVSSSIFFRSAPHALIVSASPESPCGPEDVALSLAYFELLAQSAGLGTVWWGYFKLCLTAVPELRSLAGIPEGHACYAMLFGIPSIKFARTTQKDEAAQVRRFVF